MSNLTFDPASWRDHGMAFGVACALHAGLAYLLFNLSHTPELCGCTRGRDPHPAGELAGTRSGAGAASA